ncbi:condensation domain-containing protein, partial [Priestia aryabhattai]|uniref:condensation domain-containing protein n=1 Tax=Priestia aryabhattai TaxID=412384 RepID=UPI001CFEBF46
SLSSMPTGHSISLNAEREHSIDITGMVVDKHLQLRISYNRQEFSKTSMMSLLSTYRKKLGEVTKHCMDRKETEFTPSDFTSNDLTFEDLQNIIGELT